MIGPPSFMALNLEPGGAWTWGVTGDGPLESYFDVPLWARDKPKICKLGMLDCSFAGRTSDSPAWTPGKMHHEIPEL